MRHLKRFSAFLATIIALSALAVPVFADNPDMEIMEKTAIAAPRYANIRDGKCTLTLSGTTASINGWVRFSSGNTCNIEIELLKNGSVIESWSKSSSTGYVSISKKVSGLKGGSYQAIMYYDCGSDSGSKSSSQKLI